MDLHPIVGLRSGLGARSGPASFFALVRCSDYWRPPESSAVSGFDEANGYTNAGLVATQLASRHRSHRLFFLSWPVSWLLSVSAKQENVEGTGSCVSSSSLCGRRGFTSYCSRLVSRSVYHSQGQAPIHVTAADTLVRRRRLTFPGETPRRGSSALRGK